MTNILSEDFEKKLQLSHFTMVNLKEAVFWITSEGRIFEVNEMACTMTGYTREEPINLNVRYSMVVSCSNDEITKLRMLSYVDRQEVLENFEYDTKGTPCEIVMQGKDFFCADKLEETFPREKGLKSWVAVPIYSPSS